MSPKPPSKASIYSHGVNCIFCLGDEFPMTNMPKKSADTSSSGDKISILDYVQPMCC